MPRVNTIEKARKSPGNCTHCRKEIQAGEGYRWIKPRYGSKRVRCTGSDCYFRNSDLTSSDKLSRAYSAQETAEDAIAGWDGEDAEDVAQALRDAATEISEVADEYQTSADNIRDRFSESTTADECEEKANALQEWADELESAADNLPDKPSDEDDDDDDEKPCADRWHLDEPCADRWHVFPTNEAVDRSKPCPTCTKPCPTCGKTSRAEEEKAQERVAALDDWRTEVRDAATEALNACPL